MKTRTARDQDTVTAQPIDERPAWVDDELFPFESRFVEIDGSLVHYVDEGSGPILLLPHGNPVWSFVWREVVAELRDRFRCIALDFPGFGLSSGAPDYGYTAQAHADLLVSFIDRLDLSAITLVGHNWGGPWGLYAAEQRPNRFERFILSNTWAWPLNGDPSSEFFSRSTGNRAGRAMLRHLNPLVNQFIPSGHKRRTLSEAEMRHYRDAASTPERRHAAAMLPGELIGAREFFTGLENHIRPLLNRPTLIVWADKDPIFTDKYRRRLGRTFPDATTKLITGAGHFVQSDAPEEFCQAIDEWWAEAASATS